MVSIPAWFTVDTRLGSLSIHLDTLRCFSAEMYSADLNITEKAEDDEVVNYVVEKMVLDKPLDSLSSDGTFASGSVIGGDGSFRSGLKPWKLKPSIEILCNNQILTPDMSLAIVRGYIRKNLRTLSSTTGLSREDELTEVLDASSRVLWLSIVTLILFLLFILLLFPSSWFLIK